MGVVVIASATPQQRLRRSDAVEVLVLFMTHIPIQAIGNYNTLWFWYMVPEPHGCLYIEIYFLIILFQVTIYFQYVHDYFNVHLRCCVLCHYYMCYGRLRFYCILIVYAKFFMFTLFLLYLVRNDNNKDDQSINHIISIGSGNFYLLVNRFLRSTLQWNLISNQNIFTKNTFKNGHFVLAPMR